MKNRTATLQSEQPGWEVGRKERPMMAGGRTTSAKGTKNTKKAWYKAKQHGASFNAIAAERAQNKARNQKAAKG